MADVVLAALSGSTTRAPVLGFAKLLARMCDAIPVAVHVSESCPANAVGELAFDEHVGLQLVEGDPMREIVCAAQDPAVAFVVVGAHRAPNGRAPGFITREIATRLRQPLLVVPTGASAPTSFERVLFPLEGGVATTAPIRALLDRLIFEPDTDLIAVHSFAEVEAPRFADHEPHDTEDRISAFAQHLPEGFPRRVVMRVGPVERVVPEVAADLDVTLTVVAWSQAFGPGRARLVTKLLADPTRPTLLLPTRYGTSPRTFDLRNAEEASRTTVSSDPVSRRQSSARSGRLRRGWL